MKDAVTLVMRRATVLWIGSGLFLALNIIAGFSGNIQFFRCALVLTAAFAIFGIAFGIWAARTITRRNS